MLLLLFLSFFGYAVDTSSSGVVPVSSVSEKSRKEVGTGFFVALKDRRFLLTCAHLTSGSDVRIGDRLLSSFSVVGRRTDSFHDVDVIEIREPVPAFAKYKSGVIAAPEGYPALGEMSIVPNALDAWANAKQGRLKVEVKKRDAAFALVPDWSQTAAVRESLAKQIDQWSVSDLYSNSDKARGLVYAFVGGTLWAPATIAPGMSCAPLIDRNEKGEFVVRGMGTEFKNKMLGSTFASDRLISRAIDAYLKGEVGEVSSARWKSQNGLLYQEIAPGRSEIVPALSPAGNGISTSPGNGISTSPGRTDEDSLCDPLKPTAWTTWEKIGSPPALDWDGKQVMGFLMQILGQDSILVFPNRTGIEFRQKMQKLSRLNDLPLGSIILTRFDRTLGMLMGFQVESQPLKNLKSPIVERIGDRMKITIYGSPPKQEKISFELNKYGALVRPGREDERSFFPIIELSAPSGQVYTVDLTGLFFTDVADWSVPRAETNRDGLGFAMMESVFLDGGHVDDETVMTTAMRARETLAKMKPSISYRRKCSTDEYRFSFTKVAIRPGTEILKYELDRELSLTDVRAPSPDRKPSSHLKKKSRANRH